MQRRFRRTCPLCGRPDLKNISTHLLQVHGLQSKERKPYLKQAKVSLWQPYIDKSPYMNSEKQGEKHVSRRAYSLPTKKPKTAQASLTTKPYPEFNFRHKFSLLVVGPSQSGKTYFVQQILENNRIVYDEQKRIRIFWYYNQWQDCYDSLRKSLGKSIQFERGLPELSENMSEIHTRYNNIIILPIGKTTVWERRWSVTFPKDMLSQRCISHRAIVSILAIRVSTSAEKIIGLLK